MVTGMQQQQQQPEDRAGGVEGVSGVEKSQQGYVED